MKVFSKMVNAITMMMWTWALMLLLSTCFMLQWTSFAFLQPCGHFEGGVVVRVMLAMRSKFKLVRPMDQSQMWRSKYCFLLELGCFVVHMCNNEVQSWLLLLFFALSLYFAIIKVINMPRWRCSERDFRKWQVSINSFLLWRAMFKEYLHAP